MTQTELRPYETTPDTTPDIEATSQLWVAGTRAELHDLYPVPTTDELQLLWQVYNFGARTEPAPGVYGVVSEIDTERAVDCKVIASIDLCEVVRDTADAVMKFRGQGVRDMTIACDYGPCSGLANEDVVPFVQLVMNEDLVQPIPEESDVRKIMQSWRKLGVYTVANTSTLPGCEKATLKFLGRHYPRSFDGILLPRNHDGMGTVTKGMAVKFVIDKYFGTEPLLVTHIDDAPHHNRSFIETFREYEQIDAKVFMPGYGGNDVVIPNTERTESVLEAFELANDAIRERLKNA